MDWMAEEFAKVTGDDSGAAITGKGLGSGGSEGRETAGAMGAWFVFAALQKRLHLPEKCRLVIEGFGQMGGNAAKIFASHGHKVIAVSDSQGGVVSDDEDGLDIEALLAHKASTGDVSGFPGTRDITNSELLGLKCDVLLPAAFEDQIRADNAEQIQAKVVLELANGPTTPEADDILSDRGITVIPDILVNAGGAIVSSWETRENLDGTHWTSDEIQSRLMQSMQDTVELVHARSVSQECDLRRAALVIALERLRSNSILAGDAEASEGAEYRAADAEGDVDEAERTWRRTRRERRDQRINKKKKSSDSFFFF